MPLLEMVLRLLLPSTEQGEPPLLRGWRAMSRPPSRAPCGTHPVLLLSCCSRPVLRPALMPMASLLGVLLCTASSAGPGCALWPCWVAAGMELCCRAGGWHSVLAQVGKWAEGRLHAGDGEVLAAGGPAVVLLRVAVPSVAISWLAPRRRSSSIQSCSSCRSTCNPEQQATRLGDRYTGARLVTCECKNASQECLATSNLSAFKRGKNCVMMPYSPLNGRSAHADAADLKARADLTRGSAQFGRGGNHKESAQCS